MEQYGLSEYLYRDNNLYQSHDDQNLDEEHLFHYNHFTIFQQKKEFSQPQLPLFVPTKEKQEEPTKDKELDLENQLWLTPVIAQNISFSQKAISQYKRCYQGSKNDTMELNINFKTILAAYFRELIYLNELNHQQTFHIERFVQRAPSFNSLELLYQNRQENEGIRRKCLQFFSNGTCIRRILSGRGRMKTKMMMIKFIQKMRCNLFEQGAMIKWKDNRKLRQKQQE